MLAIYKKEMRQYFRTMPGYVFLGFLVVLTAIFFLLGNILSGNTNYAVTITNALYIFFFTIILVPTLTMRLFSEEANQKTDQLLFTSPVSLGKIVIGKYLAALTLFCIGMLITGIFPFIISRYGEINSAQSFGAIFGFIFLSACCISIGMFISSISNNQIVAAIVTSVLFIFLQLMDGLISILPRTRAASVIFIVLVVALVAWYIFNTTKNFIAPIVFALVCAAIFTGAYFVNNLFLDDFAQNSLKWLSILSRFENFGVGIMNLSDIVYYITFSCTFVYLTVNVLEKRRWK